MKKAKSILALLCALFTIEGGNSVWAKSDVTSTYMTNAGLTSLDGWTIDKNFGGNGYTAWNTSGDVPVIEFYHTWGSNAGAAIGSTKTFNFSQNIKLPAGYYRLAVNAFYREGNGNGTNTKAYIYAGDKTQYVVGLANNGLGSYSGGNDLLKAANAFSKGDFSNEFDFNVTESDYDEGQSYATVDVGFHGYIDTYCSWCILGPVTLYEYTADDYKADYNAKVAEAEALYSSKMNADVRAALKAAVVDASTLTTVDDVMNAIKTLNVAIANANSSITAYASANIEAYLAKMKPVLDNTNVYDQNAYNKWYGKVEDNYTNGLYTTDEVSTLTDAGAFSTGWHSDNRIDDILLSTWSIDGTPAKNYDTKLYINTWSTEGNNDGSEFYTPFFEYWTPDDNSLGATTIKTKITGLTPNGKYTLSMRARVRQTNDKTKAAESITLKVGDDGTVADLSSGAQFNGGQFYIGNFSSVGSAGSDGTLTATITVADGSNVSWLSFYNVKYTEGEDLSSYIADYKFALDNANAALAETDYAAFQTALKGVATTYAAVDETDKKALTGATEALNLALSTYNAAVAPLKGSSIDGWTTTGNNGEFHVNTWSGEGATDGSGMTTPFIENWRAKGTNLTDATMSYIVNGLTPGYYKVTALIRTLNEVGGDAPAGSFVYANDAIARAYNGTACTNGVYDKPVVYGYVGSEGILTFGVKLIKANVNWVSWKNFSYEYAGEDLTQDIASKLTAEKAAVEGNHAVAEAQDNAIAALTATLSNANYAAAGQAIEAAYRANAVEEEVTVTAAGYATYVSDQPLDYTDATIKAYTAKVTDDGKIELTQISKVAAGTPVVLYAEGGATGYIPFFTGDADAATGNALVRGTGAAVATDGEGVTNYILNNVSGIGFYKANGQTVDTNRAYLPVAASAARLDIVFSDATAITTVQGSAVKAGAVYNLSGQRVSAPAKGLYIVDGKKIVRK